VEQAIDVEARLNERISQETPLVAVARSSEVFESPYVPYGAKGFHVSCINAGEIEKYRFDLSRR
jgi:hypothetical protein